jgi:hypothetical protein
MDVDLSEVERLAEDWSRNGLPIYSEHEVSGTYYMTCVIYPAHRILRVTYYECPPQLTDDQEGE